MHNALKFSIFFSPFQLIAFYRSTIGLSFHDVVIVNLRSVVSSAVQLCVCVCVCACVRACVCVCVVLTALYRCACVRA